jgi:integrase
MTTKINFTKATLDSLEIPEQGKRKTYNDTKLPGLCIRVTPNGKKTFSFRKRVGYQVERITLGRYPEMSVEQARKKSYLLLGEIAEGKSPSETKRAVKNEMKFLELFEQYMERHSKIHKKVWREDQAQYNRYLKKWSNRPLSSIKRRDVEQLHTRLGKERGKYCANRVLSLLHCTFEKAIEWGWEGTNPAHKIKKFKEQSRDRFLQPDELPRFFQALSEAENTTARDYILMSLLTGARRANVMGMRWDQINFETKEWRIPDTKNGSPHRLPLVDQAIELLNQRKAESDSDYVFPGKGKSGHIEEPRGTWLKVLKRAELQDLRLHDLRRSLGSWQAATGASLSIIGKTLAHKNVSTTAIYARLNIDPVRDSMNKAVKQMTAFGNSQEISKLCRSKQHQ